MAAAPHTTPAPAPAPAPAPTPAPAIAPPRRRRWLRTLGWLLLTLILLLVVAVAALAVWASRDGSLETALRLASGPLPLTAQGASGALLGNGRIDQLTWSQDDVQVQVDDAVLNWQPRELLARRLHVAELSAGRIVVNLPPAKDKEQSPSQGLPDSLALPFGLRIDVDKLALDEIEIHGPPTRTLRNIRANYHFDGDQHALVLQNAAYQDAHYRAQVQATANAGARGTMPVSVRLTGAASALLPEAEAPAFIALQAHVDGPLADMQAQVRAQAAPLPGADTGALTLPPLPAANASLQTQDNLDWPVSAEAPPLRLDAIAQITPQGALPLREAHAELYALNLHDFAPQAPVTALAAQLNLTPVAAQGVGDSTRWELHAKAVNDAAGPWDAQQLPVDRLTTAARWQNGVATIDNLLLELAGGRIEATGQWQSGDAAPGAPATDAPAGSWQLSGQIEHINPAQLHGELAAFPINGEVNASGHGADAQFALDLIAADTPVAAQGNAAVKEGADALAAQLQALALRQVQATGDYANGQLMLNNLRIETDDAQLEGHAQVDLADSTQLAVDGELTLAAPGLQLAAQAQDLAAQSGQASANLALADAAATLQWARKWPGVADLLTGAQVDGSAQLQAALERGWLAPRLHATLASPKLDVTLPAPDTAGEAFQIRNLQAEVDGRLEHATVTLNGQLLQPARNVDVQLALDAEGGWAEPVLTLDRLQLDANDARATGQIKLHLADAFAADADLQLEAPGLASTIQGQIATDQGDGTLSAKLSDAAALLEWARTLPGAADRLAGAQARGAAQLDARWEGGLANPRIHATLVSDALDVTPPAQDAAAADAVRVRSLQAEVDGHLEHATVTLNGRVLQPARQVDLQLALDAEGGWADQVLTLDRLQLDAGDASAAGHATIHLAGDFAADADLKVTAPGLTSAVKGQIAADSGAGTLNAKLSDAAATLRWAKTLPGAANALAGASASGTAQLAARWDGGFNNPRIDATLSAPQLNYTAANAADSLAVRDLQASLAGDLQNATLRTRGHVVQGEREADLRLAASGGRSQQNPDQWSLRISELATQMRAPELGNGAWTLTSRGEVPIRYNLAAGGTLDVAAGELTITSPANGTPARIAWEPIHWQDGQLHSAGRISELPMAWAEQIAGDQLKDAGVTGDLVFAGRWDIQMGRSLKMDARLEHVRGDINVHAGSDGETVAAGLQEAWVDLSSRGEQVQLALRWASDRAGNVDGTLTTRLAATPGAGGATRWSWSPQAPLQGRVQAALPEIAVWSLLAPPGWRLHGALNADLGIAGNAADPQINGTLAADELALRSVVDGIQFEDGRLRAHVQGTRLIIDEFVLQGAGADGSGGRIRVTGEAGLFDGEPSAQAHAVIDQLHASVRSDREMVVSGEVNAGLRGRTVSASGTLHVDRAHIILPDEGRPTLSDDVVIHSVDSDDKLAMQAAHESGGSLDAAEARNDAQARAKDSPLQADIGVKIDLGNEFQLDGMGIDTRLAGNLELAAHGPLTEMPSLVGQVQTVGGTFRAYGQHLLIERGNVFFSGDVSNPGLDILALRPNYASDQEIGALIQGTALLPQVRLYSQPILPDDQVLAWLILGHPAPQDGGEAAMMQSAALALLGGRDSEGLASSLGLDELSFGGDSSSGLAGASVTLGKRLSDRLYTAYEHSLSGTGGVLLIFYELSKRWALRGQASEGSAIDLIYRLSYD